MLRRRVGTRAAVVLTAALLLAGCSSSPEVAKLVAEVDTPITATAPPPGTPDDGPAPGEVSGSPAPDKGAVTTWVPRRHAPPPRDALAGVDTSDASAEQAAEIDDRDVTLDEYGAAFDRFRECMAAAGFEIGEGHFYEDRYHYTVPTEAVDDGVDEECYTSEFYYVDMLWQIADSAPRASD